MIVWQHPLFSAVGRKAGSRELENQRARSLSLNLVDYVSFEFCRQFVRRATRIQRPGVQQLIVKAEYCQQNKCETHNHPRTWPAPLRASLPPPSQSCDCEKCDENRKAVIGPEIGDDLIEDCAKATHCCKQQTKERKGCCRL